MELKPAIGDNERESIKLAHLNSATSKHLGTFASEDETRHSVAAFVDTYQQEKASLRTIEELGSLRDDR